MQFACSNSRLLWKYQHVGSCMGGRRDKHIYFGKFDKQSDVCFQQIQTYIILPEYCFVPKLEPPPPQFPCGAINSHLYLIQTTVREVTLILGVQYSSSLDTSPNPLKTIKTRCYSRNTSLSLFPEHSRRSARTWLLMTSISDDILCK